MSLQEPVICDRGEWCAFKDRIALETAGYKAALEGWMPLKEKWFSGEMVDPVFEGTVRDFCHFDETLSGINGRVERFMQGVEQLTKGMTALSEGVSANLSHTADHQISSDSCKLKEATNQIARADAPHSAIAKLRRDMKFNILNPVQAHMSNNRSLKVSLDIRRRRLAEFESAKKAFEDISKKNLPRSDKRYLQAQSVLEVAKAHFLEVDRHVFEWLYILEEYRGDILDSTLQTLKYLEYEFFATSAHAMSSALPSRMEFRPMVEMTPDHLEVQVETEMQESENQVEEFGEAGPGAVADFSLRLIEKQAKQDPGDQAAPSLPVDPLSLSSLLSQGFEEGPARRALRMHQNDTQAAMDWLIDGGTEETAALKKAQALEDGVRMPTTARRMQRLKAMRQKQQDRSRSKHRDADSKEGRQQKLRPSRGNSSSSSSSPSINRGDDSNDDEARSSEDESVKKPKAPLIKQEPVDLLDVGEARATPALATEDLLGFDSEEPVAPRDFSQSLETAPLPRLDLFYEGGARCEKPPLSSSTAVGMLQTRSGSRPELSVQVQAAQAATAETGLYSGPSDGNRQSVADCPAPLLSGLAALDPFSGLVASPRDPSRAFTTSNGHGYTSRDQDPLVINSNGRGCPEQDEFSNLVGLMAPKSSG